MAWRTVVITSHAKLNYQMNDLKVQTDRGAEQIPIDDIKVVMIATTRAVITAYAMNELSRRGVKVIFCDERGMPAGELMPYRGNGYQNKNIGKQLQWDQIHRDRLWQQIVKTKIHNQDRVLNHTVEESYPELGRLAGAVEVGDHNNREAQAARLYFPRLFGKTFVRSDERQTINGHLNYGYSLLLAILSREIVANGYLTQLGIHHTGWENAFNLASDLMEPFRPFIDACVVTQKEQPLTLEGKLNLVGVLDQVIGYQGMQMDLTQAVQRYVRECFNYLNSDVELVPEMEFEGCGTE